MCICCRRKPRHNAKEDKNVGRGKEARGGKNKKRLRSEEFLMGYMIALFGIAACVLFCGIGSCIGLYKTGTAAAGVLGEEPKKFGKVMVLVLLPATQGIYGFIIGLIASAQLKAGMDVASGWAVFAAVM
ncbi:MAG: hypothetical protein ACLTKZ_08150, partial [Lachnospiraceae bacterium]